MYAKYPAASGRSGRVQSVASPSTLLGEAGLIIGDFNTGKHYLDESGKSFACADCLDQLESVGFSDSWRERNPDAREHSWLSVAKNGFRVDLALCSERLNKQVTAIFYDHEEAAATDHSALVVELET